MNRRSGAVLETALRGACEQFVESRIREGENLKLDLIEKLDGMLTDVAAIEKRSRNSSGISHQTD